MPSFSDGYKFVVGECSLTDMQRKDVDFYNQWSTERDDLLRAARCGSFVLVHGAVEDAHYDIFVPRGRGLAHLESSFVGVLGASGLADPASTLTVHEITHPTGWPVAPPAHKPISIAA
jgi:hypothetical protein